MNDSPAAPEIVAADLLDSLHGLGIRHVFANAGTDSAPVIEALVAAHERGREVPRFHTIPHENLAIAMAQGYFLACGEPAAAMVHVTVGTANALCGIMNAARDNVPMLVMAGRTPNTESGQPGSRSANIHWGQDSFDQGGTVREYVKWDYELRSGQPVGTIVERALDIAMSAPRGPVYLTMPREVLGEPGAAQPPQRRSRGLGAEPARPSDGAIDAVARAIAGAAFPLIITAAVGRDHDNVGRLARLSERHGIAVAYQGEPGPRGVSIPSDHPMYLGVNSQEAVARADVIVVLESEVPWWPRYCKPRADATLIHIASDPLFSRYPYRGFTMDMAITGSPAAALDMLDRALEARAPAAAQVQARRQEIQRMGEARRGRNRELMQQVATQRPIHPAHVAACINGVKAEDDIIVNELGVPADWLDLTRPGTYISSSSAGGLGFGLGAALGARLALPERRIILIVGDGSYMFGNPVAAHFVGRAEGLPTLTVVMNNGRWHAVHRSTVAMYPDGRAAAAEPMPLVALEPSPDYGAIMEACGGWSERVEDPGALAAALERGLEAVSGGRSALLNVIAGT